MPDPLAKTLGNAIAAAVGTALGQEYRRDDEGWWLWQLGRPVRLLRPDEIRWHVARRHAPFVAGGATPDGPGWWDEPAGDIEIRCPDCRESQCFEREVDGVCDIKCPDCGAVFGWGNVR